MISSISRVEIEGLLSAFFTISKRRWAFSLAAETAAVLVGALSVIFSWTSLWFGIAVTVVATSSSLSRWWSDNLRADAEALLRLKEYRDGLGWSPDSRLVADLKADHPKLARLARRRQEEQSDFYDTDEEIGPTKILEMIRESAWWTSQNAAHTARFVAVGGSLLVIGSLYGTTLSWLAATPERDPVALVSLLTSVISLVFALDIGRLFFEYRSLVHEANGAQAAAEALLAKAQVEESEALRPVIRYQVARGLAPPIPDRVWRRRGKTLNDLWSEHLSRRATERREEEPETPH